MSRYIFLRRMFYFLELCKVQKTGSKHDIAGRLAMSESGVKRMITDLRNAGIPIVYSSVKRSYCLHEPVPFHFRGLEQHELVEDKVS